MTIPAAASLSVGDAAELLGRHRTRVYALLRSGDLVAAPGTAGDEQSLRIDRSSVERWAVAGGSRGGPLTPRSAWAIIGLACGDEARAHHCLGLLERREEVFRARARLEAAYEYLLEHPPLGLAIQRQGDEFFLVSAPEVGAAIERHLGNPRPVPLSRAALEVLAIVAYKQPIARAGIERIRSTSSDSALETLLMPELVALNEARLFVTTRAFLDYAGLRDLADLPPLQDLASDDANQAWGDRV